MLISLSELITTSWKTYCQHWRRLAIYVLFLFLPTLVSSIFGVLGLYLNSLIPSSALMSNIIIVVVVVASLLFSLWATVSLTYAVNQIVSGQTMAEWKQIFSSSSRLLWPFIFTSILAGLAIFGGTLLFIIPGMIFTIWFSFAVYAVILDNQRGIEALKASKKLVIGRWWLMALLIFAPNVLFVIISVVIRFLIATPFSFIISSELVMDVVRNFATSVSSALIAPLTTLAMVLLYHSAKKNPVPTTLASSLPPSNI